MIEALLLGAAAVLAGPANGSRPDAVQQSAPEPKVAMPARILIVEDEFLVALDVERIVLDGGHVVIGIAATADDAVKQAEQDRPDLVLMDIRLATARDGIDAAIELRQRLNIDCLIVSAHIYPTTKQRAAAASPRGFVSKPVSSGMLQRAIAAALNKP